MTEEIGAKINFCPACGTEVLAGARFCVACREELPTAESFDQPAEQAEVEYCEACAATLPVGNLHVMDQDQMRIAADRGYGKEIHYTADLMNFEKKKAFSELVDQGAEHWRLCDPCHQIFLGYLKKRGWRPW